MKKQILFIFIIFSCIKTYAQYVNDSANYPYYINMMQDKNINFYRTVSAANKYWEGRDSSIKGCGWKAYKRWEWSMRQLINPDGTYPDIQSWINSYYPQTTNNSGNGNFQQGLSMNTLAPSCKTRGDWKELGPGFLPYNRTNQPSGVGRVNAIGFHPTDSNTFWIGAPAGGLWKTTNNGKTWITTTDSAPTLGVSAIAASPRNPDTLYIGTGDRDAGDAAGMGVYMSINGGKTFTARNSGMGNITVGRILIHPSNTKILLAATNSGIYRSTNSGGTWSLIISGNFKDIAFNPKNPNTVFASINGLFYRSTNNGISFSQITSGLPSSGIARGAIAVTPADTNYVYFLITNSTAYYGTYLSTNGGVTFSTRSNTPNVMDYSTNGSGGGGQAWYDLDVACDPVNRDIFYVGGINVFKSTDGAATWAISAHWIGSSTLPSVHADQHIFEINPITKNLYIGNDGGIYYTRNKGAKWIDLSNGIGISQQYKIGKSASNKDLMIAGFQDNGTSYFDNVAWSTVRGGDGMDCAWDMTDENYSYGAVYYGNITRFYKGQHDITVANNGLGGINETGDWVTPYCLRKGNTNTMFVGYKNIWRNTAIKSGSMSWTNITNNGNGNNIRCVENSAAKNDILYYSRYDNRFFRSYNATGAASWVDLTSNLPVSGTVSAVACHPTDSNTVFIGLNGSIYRSRNRGISWTNLSTGLPINRLNTIALDTSNSKFGIYVGTYTGVYFKDSTTNFTSFSSGLPIAANVTDLEIFYDKRHKSLHRLHAGTYNRGSWRTALWDDGTKKPRSDFYVGNPIKCSEKIYKLIPECGYNPSAFKWIITPNTYNYQNSTDSLSEMAQVKFNAPGYYTIRLIAENCNGNDTMTKLNHIVIFDSIAVAANCKTSTSILTDNYGIGINNIELNGLSNPTSGAYEEGSNVDYSCTKTFFLKPGTKYPLTITTGPYYNEYCRIYIDYNNNGVFTDAGELVFDKYSKTIQFDTLRCPTTMVKNKVLRMRVLSDYNPIASACATLSYGQSEDYGVYFDEPVSDFTVSKDSICIGKSIIVTEKTKGFVHTYSWNFGAGAVPTAATGKGPHTIKYSTGGIKRITLTINNTIAKFKDTVFSITVPSSALLIKEGSTTQCEGDTITLVSRDSKKVANKFQWQFNNTTISGSIDSLNKLWNHKATNSGNYRCINNYLGCKDTTANVSILINPKPKIGYTVNNLNQCLKGNSFIITDTTKLSSGWYSLKYFYSNNTTDTNKNHVKKFNLVNAYTLKQVVTSNKGCKDSTTKSINVYPQAVLGFNINDTDQCLKGNNFIFTNSSNISSGTLSSNWNYGNGNTSSSTNGNQSYMINNNYSVRLSTNSNNNCKDTLTKKIIVFESPKAGFTMNDSDQCLRSNNFIFTNTSTLSAGTFTNAWNYGNSTTSSGINGSKKYSSTNTYNTKLVVTSNNNCKDSIIKKAYVFAMPTANFAINDTSQCLPINAFTFIASSSIISGTITNNWNYGDATTGIGNTVNKTYSANNAYNVRLIAISNKQCNDTSIQKIMVYKAPKAQFSALPTNQCLKNNLISFTNSSTSYKVYSTSYNFGDATNSNLNNPTHKYTNAGIYKVLLTAQVKLGCSDTISKYITINPQPIANFTINNTTQCKKGNNFVFTNTSSLGSSYAWNFGDGNSSTNNSPNNIYGIDGNYNVRLIAISNQNCKDTTQKSLTVYPSPAASFTINKNEQCLRGNAFIYTSTSNINSGNLSHNWDLGNSTTSASNIANAIYNGANTYNIKLISTSNNNCKDTNSQTVIVHPMPVANFTINDSIQCDYNNNFIFTNSSIYSNGLFTSNWVLNNMAPIVQNNINYNFNASGIKTVKLLIFTDKLCKDSIIKNVVVVKKPDAAFTQTSLNTEETLFKAKISTYFSYKWLFADGSINLDSQIKKTFVQNGNYLTILFVEDKNGCKDTSKQNIAIISGALRVIENANNFYIYPNPTSSKANLKLELTESSFLKINVYTELGQLIYSIAETELKPNIYVYTIDFEKDKLAKGIYIIKIETIKGKNTEKIIFE